MALRADRQGPHRSQADKNKRIILMTQDVCAICGQPVDKSLKWPHPLCPTVDHIIPVDKGGHPSDINNMQLAHFTCNRRKWDRVAEPVAPAESKSIGNRLLPQSRDWAAYRAGDG